MKKAKNAMFPHCPGETHTPSVKRIMSTMPRFVGLKICFPLKRNVNLLKIVIKAARPTSNKEFVLRSRQRDRPEISVLRGSYFGSLKTFVQTY
jgi:hypothetical protein